MAQVGFLLNLTRRVSQKRGRDIILHEAASVIRNANERNSAVLDIDGNRIGSGIERILDKLLNKGSRSFDDFPCGDPVNRIRTQ